MDGFVFGMPEPTPEQKAELEHRHQVFVGKVHAEMSSVMNLLHDLDEQGLKTLTGLARNILSDSDTGHYLIGIIDSQLNTRYGICMVSGCYEHHLDHNDLLKGSAISDDKPE